MRDNEDQGIVSSVIIVMLVLFFITSMLSGCSTVVPVAAKFPDAPGKGAMTACPDLKKLNDDAKLSGVANTVADNYNTYYLCAIKTDTWIEWYEIQKRIYEGAAK